MRTCPWCGRENLNVYIYCQSCGRGFDEPPGLAKKKDSKPFWKRLMPSGK